MSARGEKPSKLGLTYEDRKRWRESFTKWLMVCVLPSNLKPGPQPNPFPTPGPGPDPDPDPDSDPNPNPAQLYVLPSYRERVDLPGGPGDPVDHAWLPYFIRWINSGGLKVIFERDREEEDKAHEEAEEARKKADGL